MSFIAIAVVTLGCGAVSLVYPFGRDQGLFAYQADALLHGLRLYRDLPMMQLPMTAVVHLVALVLFGRSMTAIRILDLLWTASIAVLLYTCVRSMFRRDGLALLAGLLYPFLYYTFDWWHTAEVDGLLNLPVVGAFALAASAVNCLTGTPARADSRTAGPPAARARWFFAGLLVAVATLFKYTAALVLPALLVWPLLVGRDRAGARGALLWLVTGFAAGVAGFLLTAVVAGVLPDMVRMQVHVTLPYAGIARYHLSFPARVVALFRLFARGAGGDFLPGIVLAGLGLVPATATLLARGPEAKTAGPPAAADRNARAAALVTLAWLATGLASVFIQNKFFYYHYLIVVPALAVLGGMALARMAGPLWWLARGWQRALLAVAAAAAMLVASPYPDRYPVVARVARGAESLEQSWMSTGYRSGDFVAAEQVALAGYLAANTRPDERVFNLGIDPWVVFPAWRRPVVRFTSPPNTRACTLTAAFRNDPPEVVLVKHGDRLPWVRGSEEDSYERLMAMDYFRDFILVNYELETRIGQFDVLRLVGGARTMPGGATPGDRLAADIEEAHRVVGGLAPGSYRYLFWPLDDTPRIPGLVLERIITYRTLNRMLWTDYGRSLADLLPAVSVWVRGDDRPFARLDPFRFQNDREDYITDQYRFQLLHTCGNGLVLVYLVEDRTDEETTGYGNARGHRGTLTR